MNARALQHPLSDISSYDEEFFDRAVDLFIGLESGHMGKYIYEDPATTQNATQEHGYLWQDVLHQNEPSYYLPEADNDLLERACREIPNHIPVSTPVVDFGVGGLAAFNAHIRPILKTLSSSGYIGIDSCKDYLSAINAISRTTDEIKIKTYEMDFFRPYKKDISLKPSLGIMTCSTIGNIYGGLNNSNIDIELTYSLRTLSNLTGRGWLLLSVDTNQDEASLMQGYNRPLMSKLFLTSLNRIARELPTTGFNPDLFAYTPEWHEEKQLYAHIAQATENQTFDLGPYTIHITKGQKFHLLNSYKFRPDFFESCCEKAGLDILNVWKHKKPMNLYLLQDKENPVQTADRAELEKAKSA